MKKYKVTQMYATVRDVHLNKKLENKIVHGIIQAKDALSAIRIVSYQTDVSEICLMAQEVSE
ncbi:MAG TPA: hypothetical protein VF974_00730 [Patescibacteria group bacterium]